MLLALRKIPFTKLLYTPLHITPAALGQDYAWKSTAHSDKMATADFLKKTMTNLKFF